MESPRIRCRLFSTVLAIVLMAGGGMRGQSSEATTLRLGDASAPPGAPVVALLTLTYPDGVEVGAVDLRLTFPKTLLKFVKMEPSGLALGVEAILQAEVNDGPDKNSSTLHASISTIATGGSRKGLPSGPLAYLSFTVAASAKPQTAIALVPEATALNTATPAGPVKPLVAAPAKISVANPPVPACFLYMH